MNPYFHVTDIRCEVRRKGLLELTVSTKFTITPSSLAEELEVFEVLSGMYPSDREDPSVATILAATIGGNTEEADKLVSNLNQKIMQARGSN